MKSATTAAATLSTPDTRLVLVTTTGDVYTQSSLILQFDFVGNSDTSFVVS